MPVVFDPASVQYEPVFVVTQGSGGYYRNSFLQQKLNPVPGPINGFPNWLEGGYIVTPIESLDQQ